MLLYPNVELCDEKQYNFKQMGESNCLGTF